MTNIITITELILFALGLSLVINATHIAFQKEMVLNWLYEWLESKFRNNANKRVCDLDYEIMKYAKSENNTHVSHNKEFDITKKWKFIVDSKEKAEYYDKCWNTITFDHIIYESKYRNSEGLLYIAKPIYSCASCMPSLWSLPLLFILPIWKVFFICIFASVISTLIRDKIFE